MAQRLGLRIVRDQDLREIGCGDGDWVPIAMVRARLASAWSANEAQRDPDFRWPGGESYREVRLRVLGAIRRIAAAHVAVEVVLTHAGVISQLIGFCQGVSPACWERYRPGNASLTRLLWHREQGGVLRFGADPGAPDEPEGSDAAARAHRERRRLARSSTRRPPPPLAQLPLVVPVGRVPHETAGAPERMQTRERTEYVACALWSARFDPRTREVEAHGSGRVQWGAPGDCEHA